MTDLFLVFTDTAAAGTALAAAGCDTTGWDLNTGIYHGPGFVAERVEVPVFSEPDGEGNQHITGYVPGVHINVRVYGAGIDTGSLTPFIVEPVTPFRVFA